MINISNCPITGLKRKITHKNFFWFESTKQIIIECYISHYDNNNVLVENSRIKSYKRSLVASDSYVNVTNGEVLTQQQLNDREETLYLINNFNTIHSQWQVAHDNWLSIANNSLPEPIEPVLPEQPFNIMQEYDYYVTVLGVTPLILPNLINQIIQLRDSQGKFDI